MVDCIDLFLAMSTIETTIKEVEDTNDDDNKEINRDFLYLFGITSFFLIHNAMRVWRK